MNTSTEYGAVLDWFNAHPFFGLAILAWSLAWKGVALWKASGLRQKYWFVAILVVNTLGLLEIIYLLLNRNNKVEVVES